MQCCPSNQTAKLAKLYSHGEGIAASPKLEISNLTRAAQLLPLFCLTCKGIRSPPASRAAAGGLIGVNPIPENGFLLSCGLAGVLNALSGPAPMLVTGIKRAKRWLQEVYVLGGADVAVI